MGATCHSSANAEMSSLIWASLWAYQSTAQHMIVPQRGFNFHFDSIGAGFQAAGEWGPSLESQSPLTTMMRATFSALENKADVLYSHIKSHCGQPWNELCDVISKERQEGNIPSWVPNVLWPAARTQKEFMTWLPTADLPSVNTGDENIELLGFNLMKQMPFSWNPLHTSQSSPNREIIFQGLCATYNTMTLRKKGALELLRHQCHSKGIGIVALQETRDRHSRYGRVDTTYGL